MAGIAAAGTAQIFLSQIPVNPAQAVLQERAARLFHPNLFSQEINPPAKVKAGSLKRSVPSHGLLIDRNIPASAAGFRAGGANAAKFLIIFRNCGCLSKLSFFCLLIPFPVFQSFLPFCSASFRQAHSCRLSCPAPLPRLLPALQTPFLFRPSVLYPGGTFRPFSGFRTEDDPPAEV